MIDSTRRGFLTGIAVGTTALVTVGLPTVTEAAVAPAPTDLYERWCSLLAQYEAKQITQEQVYVGIVDLGLVDHPKVVSRILREDHARFSLWMKRLANMYSNDKERFHALLDVTRNPDRKNFWA